MSEIDITVPEGERSEFMYQHRPVWPRIPTPCPVESCQPNTLYRNFKDFITHWKKFHTEYNKVYVCSCGKFFATKKHEKHHLNMFRNHESQADRTIKNENYTSPGEVLPYQYGNAEDRQNMKDIQRQIASNKRKLEVEKYSEARHLLCSTSGENVCRDERVLPRDGRLVKDTNLWDNPKRRRRTVFRKTDGFSS